MFPNFHYERWAGIETQKFSNGGDLGAVPFCQKHNYKLNGDINDCPTQNIFIEVKNRANPNIWGSMKKAEDDGEQFGKNMAILYAIKHKKGERGSRLICLRPETLKYLINFISKN